MTTDPHLRDEDLSALLDGLAAPSAGAHVEGCDACGGRLAALGAARDAVAGAVVPPLAVDDLDRLIGAALAVEIDSAAGADVVPLAAARRRRGRRLTTPPPAWILGAVAAVAVLVGMAGLLRTTTDRDSRADSALMAADDEGSGESGAVSSGGAGAGGAFAESTARGFDAADPFVVSGDLGEIAGPDQLRAALGAADGGATKASPAAGSVGSPADADAAADADTAATTVPAAPVAPPGERAQCVADAERIGAGTIRALERTVRVRWAGRDAEVLVFALTEPAGGFSRQALVLSRPGCELLADPRL